ncbi:MAG: hypothetical protein Q9212_004215 [Teloschistes hypoglaucus]
MFSPYTVTVTQGIASDRLSSYFVASLIAYLDPSTDCFLIPHILTPEVAHIPSMPTMSATPKGSISIGTPIVTASANFTISTPFTDTGANVRDNTVKIVKIVNSVVFPVVGVAIAFVLGIILLKRRRRKLRRTEKVSEGSGEADAPPFLQMRPELDALQQRHELEVVPKERCELEGQSDRQEMVTQADEENCVIHPIQEMRVVEPSHELDGKPVPSGKDPNIKPLPLDDPPFRLSLLGEPKGANERMA